MTDEVSPQLGMSRRDLLRRGAIVGGTLMWAAPTVQALGPRAFASTTNGTPRDCRAISYLAVVITNGETYQFKINADGTVETELTDAVPKCPEPEGWGEEGNIGGYPSGTTWDITDECCWSITLPSNGWNLVGVAMGAGGDDTDQGYCVDEPTTNGNGLTYTFCAPPK